MNFIKNRKLLIGLIRNDFKQRFAGNYLGIVWAFLQPLITIAVYWFVFTNGFKSPPIQNVPFLLWLLCGLVPWFLINECIIGASESITQNIYLVKKVMFEVKLLPLVKLGSALLVNFVFYLLMLLCFLLFGFKPHWFWLQTFYYFFATIFFVFGVALLLSSIVVFVKDVSHVVLIVMQLFFWMTPIFWNISLVTSQPILFILKMNPVYYIINGFRESLIYGVPFWKHTWLTIYFWIICLLTFYTGNKVFNKLQPHFSDVL